MAQQKGSAHVIIAIGLVVLLVGTLGFMVWQNFINKKADSTDDATSKSVSEKKAESKVEDSKSAQPTTGFITGKRVYPSEVLPADFKVCAINNTTKQEVRDGLTGLGFNSFISTL